MVVKIAGGNALFKKFIKACVDCILIEFDSAEALLLDSAACDVCFLLPQEGSPCLDSLSYENTGRLGRLKKAGVRIYIENYISVGAHQGRIVCYGTEAPPTPIGASILTADGSLWDFFGETALFQARCSHYLPGDSAIRGESRPHYEPLDAEVLMRLGMHIGTVSTEDDTKNDTPVLFRSEGLFASLIPLSRFDPVTMLPYYRYRKLFGYLFGAVLKTELLSVEQAFATTYRRLEPAMQKDQPLTDRKHCFENAVKNAVEWHFGSGIIQGPFSVELITSSTGVLNESRRVDTGMYTGWLLYEAGCHFENTEWKEQGRTIFDYYADRSQIEEGVFKGLFRWYLYDYGPTDLYTIDCGRCGISLVNMYRLTGEQKYLRQIRLLADGFLNWFSEDGLMSSVSLFYYNDPNLDHFKENRSSKTPAGCGEVGLFMGMASKLLNEEKYVRACVGLAQGLCNLFPDYAYYGHTTSIRYARFLMLLAAVQDSGLADFSEMIRRLLQHLSRIQLPCGGIYVEDNLSYEKYGQTGFGGENGVNAPWEEEKISDQLYSVNNALMALSALTKAAHLEKDVADTAHAMHRKLLDYVTRIQIVHPDKKYNGGWMRAFDITRWEYYGLNVEAQWGSYCIMAGWTMGILPLELLAATEETNHFIL